MGELAEDIYSPHPNPRQAAPALLSVSVPDSTLPIPSLESYHLLPCRRLPEEEGIDCWVIDCRFNNNVGLQAD